MRYILGIDLGTSGTKTILFNEKGKKIYSSIKEYEILSIKAGFAEQDPNMWWEAVIFTIKDIITNSNVRKEDIKSIGLSGQMHGLVMVNEYGEVLRNSILWCDNRTKIQCDKINELVGEKRLIEICANKALINFTASKILWVKENEPYIYKKAYKLLLPKDYIRYKLVGEFATEPTDASGTNLLDIKTRDWSDEILQKLDIDKKLMPKIYESTHIAGNVTKNASEQTGLSINTVVCMGTSDNVAAAIGTGVIENGKAVTTIGTSGAILVHTDKLLIDNDCRVHTFCHIMPDTWLILSCTLCAGMSIKWFKEEFFCKDEDTYKKIETKLKDISIGSEKLIFLPYLIGERSPILDEKARGVFFGISTIHNKFHMMQAIMEGVGYSQKQCLDIIKNMGIEINKMYLCGGGAKSEKLHQIISDLYDKKITTLQNEEGPALGASILASVASGIYKDIKSASKIFIRENITKMPQENSKDYDKYFEIYKKLYLKLKEEFNDLYELL